MERFIILKAAERQRLAPFEFRIRFLALFDCLSHICVVRPCSQHVVKNVVARNDPTPVRNPVWKAFVVISERIFAARSIGVKQLSGIERGDSIQLEPLCDQVQDRAFSGTVSAVKDRDLSKQDFRELFFPEDAAGVNVIDISPVFAHAMMDQRFF